MPTPINDLLLLGDDAPQHLNVLIDPRQLFSGWPEHVFFIEQQLQDGRAAVISPGQLQMVDAMIGIGRGHQR